MTTIGVVFVRHGTRIKLIAILFAYRRTVQKLFMHQSQSGRQEFNACTAIQCAFERFQPVDLSFGLAIAPAFGQRVFDCGDISPQRASEARKVQFAPNRADPPGVVALGRERAPGLSPWHRNGAPAAMSQSGKGG